MSPKLSRRRFAAVVGGIGIASTGAGAGTYALLGDQENATGSIQAADDFPNRVVRINAGGPSYTAADGTTFAADQYATGGSTYSTGDAIAGTNDDALYQSERYDNANGFGYDVPIADGTYDVLFHFAEVYWGGDGNGGGTGTRVFDLDVEGATVRSDYDIYDAASGHDVVVLEAAEGISVTDGQLSISTTTSTDNAKFSAVEVVPSPHPALDFEQVDTTPSGTASFDVANLVVEAAGADVWQNNDEYGALYKPAISGDFTATVTVHSQEAVHQWSKAGIMVANDVTDAGGSAGDLFMAVTPDNGYQALYDSDGDGYVDRSPDDGSTSVYSSRLRIVKTGTDFACSYSTDGGSSWTRIADLTIPEANVAQDVGLAVTSHQANQTSRVDFSNFTTA